MTIDVEDWYDGMAVLGHHLKRPSSAGTGIPSLISLLDGHRADPRVTLFVVGAYAPQVRAELAHLAAAGHEIGCHGADHGRLPANRAALAEWLRRGRGMLEDLLQVPVSGFRSPWFEIPPSVSLVSYRDLLAEAGYQYVSDIHRLGPGSAVAELPVLRKAGLLLGGGSYQRLLPARAVTMAIRRSPRPTVLYYHSYDFGRALPRPGSVRSMTVAKQVLGRSRIAAIFAELISRHGSQTCAQTMH